jgi:aspartyl-tRNA(Asn)/glutamyl-tRNA(Gln) amidotransferase subunit C
MSISKKDVEYVARLSRLALTEEEKERYTTQLAHILTYIEKLNQLNTDGVAPTAHILPIANAWREDKVRVGHLGTTQALLQNAPEREGPLFKVKKVIE